MMAFFICRYLKLEKIMHLLYLDDSGSPCDPQTKFFVMAGFSIFERQTHWLESQLNPIAARFNPTNPETVELHGSPMRSGSDGWKQFSPKDRVQAVADALHLLSDKQTKIRVYAAVIEKSLLANSTDIVPHAFEAIASRFDNYLAACYTRKKDPQRGIVIFDNATFEQSVQSLTKVFKHQGHANGRLRNFAEVPLFLDSRASRLIQMADLIAYWIFRRYESLDEQGFNLIRPYLHAYGGVTHGLYELISPKTQEAMNNIPLHPYPFPKPNSIGSIISVTARI